MTDQAADKINMAIHDCLGFCYKAEAPLARLAEFLALLRSDQSWREVEILHVESSVRRVLTIIISVTDDDALSA
jgi:hypothetical protein